MSNLDPQIATDFAGSFLRVDNGFATNGLLGASGVTTVPLTTGTSVVGIFDRPTVTAGARGGPRWWCHEADGYAIGRYLTVTGEGTFQIAAINPEDDGHILSCLLEARS